MKPVVVTDRTGYAATVTHGPGSVRLRTDGKLVLHPHQARALAYALLNAADAARFPSTEREGGDAGPSRSRVDVGPAAGYDGVTVMIYDTEEAGAPAWPNVVLVPIGKSKLFVVTYAPPEECDAVREKLTTAICSLGGPA